MSKMKIAYPHEIPADPRAAFRAGWEARASAGGRKARAVKSEARSEASRINGTRPKKAKVRSVES